MRLAGFRVIRKFLAKIASLPSKYPARGIVINLKIRLNKTMVFKRYAGTAREEGN
jgi:hypothetical protein